MKTGILIALVSPLPLLLLASAPPESAPEPQLEVALGEGDPCGYCDCTLGAYDIEQVGSDYVEIRANCAYDGECEENAQSDCTSVEDCQVDYVYAWSVPTGSDCQLEFTSYWRDAQGLQQLCWLAPLASVSGSNTLRQSVGCGEGLRVELQCTFPEPETRVLTADTTATCSVCP